MGCFDNFILYKMHDESNLTALKNRPNGSYIFEANGQELYVLTEHWKSDLLFYKEGLNFLNHLIDKYFIWISKKEDADLVQKIDASILKTSEQCSNLIKRVDKHLAHLANLIENPFKYDSHKFRNEHQELEDDITKFIKIFRANREKVFAITEHVIESDEFIRQITVS